MIHHHEAGLLFGDWHRHAIWVVSFFRPRVVNNSHAHKNLTNHHSFVVQIQKQEGPAPARGTGQCSTERTKIETCTPCSIPLESGPNASSFAVTGTGGDATPSVGGTPYYTYTCDDYS
jgi:hypothetical protein